MSTYGFKSWLSYWWWRFRQRKRKIEIEEKPHWSSWHGKNMLIARIHVGGYKDPYDSLKDIKRRPVKDLPFRYVTTY